MEYRKSKASKHWKEKSSLAAPTVLGVAAGIILGDLMHRGARRPVAFSLVCLGLLALSPTVVGAVKNKVAGPQTKRGSRKTLDSIRNGGIFDGDTTYLDEDDEEAMYIG